MAFMRRFVKKLLTLMLCICIIGTNLMIPTAVNAADGTIVISGSNKAGQTFEITVNDSDLNTDSEAAQEITVQVASSCDETVLEVVLKENSADSGSFTGSVKIAEATNGTSIPPEISGEAGSTITVKYVDASRGELEVSEAFTVISGDTQAAGGSVTDPDGAAFGQGHIDVEKYIDDQNSQFLYGVPLNSDGTFSLQSLEDGKYKIRATPEMVNTDYVSSQWMDVYVSNGKVTDPVSDIKLILDRSQVVGTVMYPSSGGSNVEGDKYRIIIRSTEPEIGYNISFICNNESNKYKAGGLQAGTYAIKAEPCDALAYTYASSFESTFTVGDTTDAQTIDLELTNPQLTGTVTDSPGTDSQAVGGGNVDILDSTDNHNYIGSVSVNQEGKFIIGNLTDGTYFIRANPPCDTSLGCTYGASDLFMIEITSAVCEPSDATLVLNQKKLTLKYVEPFEKDNNELRVRIDNVSLLNNNFTTLTAQISGNELANPVELNFKRNDGIWEEEALLIFNADNINLPYGRYSVAIINNSDEIFYENNTLDVIQRVIVNPFVTTLAKYKTEGMALKIETEERDGEKQEPVWRAGETLTVKITANGSDGIAPVEEFDTIVEPNALDGTLSVTIPAVGSAIEGSRCVEVFKTGKSDEKILIARSGFNVGESTIKEVYSREGSNEIIVNGSNLGNYYLGAPAAEVWLNNEKIADSKNIRFMDELFVEFPVSFEAGKAYKLKLFVNGQEVTAAENGGNAVNIVPRLCCTNPVIVTNTDYSITINESSFDGFGWSASDKDDVTVCINGPGLPCYTADSSTGITVSDTSIELAVKDEYGNKLSLEPGEFFVDVFRRNGTRLGFAEFIAANSCDDVLLGEVKNSSGGTDSSCTVKIQKEGCDFCEWVSVGSDGKFYIQKERLNWRDGRYILTAVPSPTSNDAPGVFEFTVSGGTFPANIPSNVTISLQKVQVKGTVYAGGNTAAGGNVDICVYESEWDWWKWIGSSEIAADGTYKLGGLTEGRRYSINAGPPWEIDYLSSEGVEFVYKATTDETPVVMNISFSNPQIAGTAKDFKGNMLGDDQFELTVRPLNSQDNNNEWRPRGEGKFILGKLLPGDYAVAIRPRGDSPYSMSEEQFVKISDNGAAAPNTLELTLTEPKLMGHVYDINGVALQDGYVEIFKGSRNYYEYINSVFISSSGEYKIGGLPDGDYYIRAGVGNDSELYDTNSKSMLTLVTISNQTSSWDLDLTDRLVPRISRIDGAGIKSDRIKLRLLNYRKIDMSKLKAYITDVEATSSIIEIPYDRIKITWEDYEADEAELELYVENGIMLEAGEYALKLMYNVTPVSSDSLTGNKISIYYDLTALPKGALPEETPGMQVKMFVDNGSGGAITGLWSGGDTLAFKLVTSKAQEYKDLSYTLKEDGTITVVMPDSASLTGGMLPDGWNTVELYKNGLLFAAGGINIGNPVIKGAVNANEGDNNIRVEGEYLAVFEDPSTVGEVLDANDNLLWSSSEEFFEENGLEFKFDDTMLPVGSYKLRIKYRDSIIETLSFKVVPQLVCTPHAVSGQSETTVTIKNSSLSDFKWGADDNIADFKVCIGSPDHYFEVYSVNGLLFDADKNLAVNISAENMEGLTGNEGTAHIDIYKNDIKIGFCRMTIGSDVISGIALKPDSSSPEGYSPAAGAKVKITNLHEYDYNNITVAADCEGRFYLSKQELPGSNENMDGDYSFVVIPPKDSEFASGFSVFNIDSNRTNDVTVKLSGQTQISGAVKEGAVNAGGSCIDVNMESADGSWRYLFNLDLYEDGTFKIGGLEAGTYYIKANEPNGSQYLPSYHKKVIIKADSTAQDITLELNTAQISGTATDAAGAALRGCQYHVRVRSLDPEKGDRIIQEWRADNGEYRVGCLEPGDYAVCIQPNGDSEYTQSFEVIFTVNADGTVTNSDIPLQLTMPKLVGTVAAAAGAATECCVDVFKGTWQNMQFVTSVDTDSNGRFRIGGLPGGKYYIRAAIWSGSELKNTYSQSVMTEITLAEDTPDVLPEKELSLKDKAPRIRCVYDGYIGSDMLWARIVNVSEIDFSKITAMLLKGDEPVADFGITDIWVEEQSRDNDKDEAVILIRLKNNLNIAPGKFKLVLEYNDTVLENETPEVDGFNGINVVYRLNADPFAINPEDTGTKTIELGVEDEPAKNPWTSSDTLTIKLISEDGTAIDTLGNSISEGNILTATLPSTSLAKGRYTLAVYKGTLLLAASDIIVGYPVIRGVGEIRENSDNINIYGDNLIIYSGSDTIANVYNSEGTLLLTSTDIYFMYENLIVGMDGKTLDPGEYSVELIYKGQTVLTREDGKFTVGTELKATPGYLLTGNSTGTGGTTGNSVTLDIPEGKTVPWNDKDTLKIRISNDDYWGENYEITPTDIGASSISFIMPSITNPGHCSINIYKVTDTSEKYIAFADFQMVSLTQLTGTITETVKDTNSNLVPVPYASVYLSREGEEDWGCRFDADKNGHYAVYGLEPGKYTVYAAPPEGKTYMDSEGFDITINSDMSCSAATHDFALLPGKLISGIITLPEAAPEGGTGIWICAWNDKGTPDNNDDDYGVARGAVIEKGFSKYFYSMIVPENSGSYYVQVWGRGQDIVNCGMLYSDKGSVYSIAGATKLDTDTDKTGINITLEKGRTISGTVILPEAVPEDGRMIRVNVFNDNNTQNNPLDDISAGYMVEIAKGEKSADYAIIVPAMAGYRVVYYEADSACLYENGGFYAKEGTVFDYNSAELLDVTTENKTGINLSVSNAMSPVCLEAAAIEDGTAIRLIFSKPLNKELLPAVPAGFTVKVGADAYAISSIVVNEKGNELTLQLKDYRIFKDYTDIKVAYDSKEAAVQSYDGLPLESFSGMEVSNKSLKTLSIITGLANGALLNRDVVINAACAGEAINIKDNGLEAAAGTGAVSKSITSEGKHTITISVTGRKQDTVITFTIDKTPPDITISNCSSIKNSHDGVTPLITFANDCVPGTKVVAVNGQTYDGSTIKKAGKYTVTASAKDNAGNIRTVCKEFEIIWDTGAPVIKVSGVADVCIYESAALAIALERDANTLQENSNESNYYYTGSLTLPDGTVKLFDKNSIPAVEAAGRYRLDITAVNPGYTDITSSKAVEFTIDRDNPVAAISNVTNSNSNIFNTAVTPLISFTDNVASQQTLMANATVALTRNSSKVDYTIGDTISADGVYTLTAETKDAFGHAAVLKSAGFTIDRTKPVITVSGALNGYTYKNRNVTVTIKTSENAQLTVLKNGEAVIPDANGQLAFTGKGGSIETYKLEMKAVDAAGNITEQQLAFTIDRLAVDIIVNGISDGSIINYNPNISFTTFEGDIEKQGTKAAIDGAAFAGGSYTAPGSHTMVLTYTSGDVTYTKSICFVMDKTAPAMSIRKVSKNNVEETGNIYVKAGDSIKVIADISDANGISEAYFTIGTAAAGISMKLNAESGNYEGEFVVESGNYTELDISVAAKDKAGNSASLMHGNKVTIDNTKPSVSAVTSPLAADGRNGIFKAANMTITLTAGENDTIYYNLNNIQGTSTANTVVLDTDTGKNASIKQGTNILVYHAQDKAGNTSDDKVYIFEYDNIKPKDVTLSSPKDGLVNTGTIGINGSVADEGNKAGSRVLLRKTGEIVASASIKADNTFVMDGIKLVEGLNSFTLTAVDLAGNESAIPVMVSRTLDSTAPIVNVEKVDDTHYTITVNEDVAQPTAKFNGVAVALDKIVAVPAGQHKMYTVETPAQVEGANTLNVYALDTAQNIGTGSFTSTYIPAETAQNDVPLSDNATIDIPGTAFNSSVQMLVKTVDANQNTNYKPLGAAVSFEFKDGTNTAVEPKAPLIVKNYIGTGLTGVVLMHINSNGVVDKTVPAMVVSSTEFKIDEMGAFDDPVNPIAYYLSDTGYVIFKTSTFSGYSMAQDVTAPEIVLSTTDFTINKADKDAGNMKITGTLKMGGNSTADDTTAHITEVTVDGSAISLIGLTTGYNFDIPLVMSDGTHEVVVKAADTAGNTSTITRTYIVDITPPVLAANTSTYSTNRKSTDISIDVNETAEIYINGVSRGHYTGSVVLPFDLTDGADNEIIVSAVDTFGNNIAAPAIKVACDMTAPKINITGVNDGDVYNSVTIGVSVTDTHNPQYTVTMDGAAYVPGTYEVEGQHTLRVDASDSFGNTASSVVAFAIDKSVPVINVTGAVENVVYGENKTLTISVINATETIAAISEDGKAPQPLTMALTGGDVTVGRNGECHTYKITVTARKTVGGNVINANRTFSLTVDRKAPVITSTTAAQTEAATINITGTVDEEADIYLNGVKVITGNKAGAFSITGRSLEKGNNVFTVKAVDMAGNESAITITVVKNDPVIVGPGNDGGFTPPVTVPAEPVNATITKEPVLSGSTAKSAATCEEISSAFKQAAADAKGNKTIIIDVKRLAGAKAYEQEIPASIMGAVNAKQNIAIFTPYATVTIPGNMFTAAETVNKKTVAISIAAVDAAKLDKDIAKAVGSKPVIDLSVLIDGKAIEWNNADAPVTVSIDCKLSGEELKNPEHIVVWYIDSNGRAVAVPNGRYDAKTGKVTFTTTHFSRYAVSYVNKTFSDIEKYGWAARQIEVLASKGVINGKSATAFDPGSDITRADFIVLLVKALGLTTKVESNFTDVKAADYYYEAVGMAKKLGITGGAGNNMFNPGERITRQDMMVLVDRALKLKNKLASSGKASDLSRFSDAGSIAAYAQSSVANLVKDGIVSGSGNSINPLGYATRAEIAVIVYRIYNK